MEWVTVSQNIKASYDTNKNRGSNAAKQSKPVRGRVRGGNDSSWVSYKSMKDAARTLGLHVSNINECCKKIRNRAGDYEFEFDTPNEPPLLEGEEWRDVAGTKAGVSSLGRFRTTRGIIHTPKAKASGYVEVGLLSKVHLLSKLIAIAFELPRSSAAANQVQHINGDPSDNRLCNLKWVTASENINASYARNSNRASPRDRLLKNNGEPPLLEGEEWRELTDEMLKIARNWRFVKTGGAPKAPKTTAAPSPSLTKTTLADYWKQFLPVVRLPA